MNVETISDLIWMRLSNVALGHLRPPRTDKNAARPNFKLINAEVSNEFYKNIYANTTHDLVYTDNLGPNYVDAGWENLVKLWRETEEAQKGKTNLPEPAAKAQWVADKDSAQCATLTCAARFGVFTRRHHCRLCGEVFCDKCTGKQLDILNPLAENGHVQGLQRNQRVCDGCHDAWKRNFWNTKKVQIDDKTKIPGARLWEMFTEGELRGRFQFVVTEGGGVVLLSRLDRAFQSYFHAKPDAKKAFHGFKIFGEQMGKGRADSCVIYLTKVFRDGRVRGFWDWIQNQPDQRDFKASVGKNYTAPGLYNMGEGAWGFDLPTPERTCDVLNKVHGGSAGALISYVLGRGYVNAAKFLHDKVNLSQQTLTERARCEVKTLVRSLYP